MPKIHLTPSFVANPPKQNGKAMVDYFDTEIPGFLLEVRSTGEVYLLSAIPGQVRKTQAVQDRAYRLHISGRCQDQGQANPVPDNNGL